MSVPVDEPPVDLCVLADPYLMTNEVRTLERAVSETGVTVPLVVVNDPVHPDIDPDAEARAINNRLGADALRILFQTLKRDRAWTLVFAEKKIAEAFGSEAAATGRVHVEDVSCLSDSEFHYVTPMTEGNWVELPPDAVDLVQKNCDVAVRFGFGLLKGDILLVPEFGVLSFHPADIREYRGLGVPQAWLDGRETMGVTLQRLNEKIDRVSTTLAHDEAWLQEAALTAPGGMSGEDRRLVVLLYDGDAPATPTRENADENLHLWVDVEAGASEEGAG